VLEALVPRSPPPWFPSKSSISAIGRRLPRTPVRSQRPDVGCEGGQYDLSDRTSAVKWPDTTLASEGFSASEGDQVEETPKPLYQNRLEISPAKARQREALRTEIHERSVREDFRHTDQNVSARPASRKHSIVRGESAGGRRGALVSLALDQVMGSDGTFASCLACIYWQLQKTLLTERSRLPHHVPGGSGANRIFVNG